MYGNPLLSAHNNFINRTVVGNNENASDKRYINEQSEIIKNNYKNIPSNFTPPYNDMYTAIPGIFGKKFPPNECHQNSNKNTSNRYDPLGDFLFKKGLLNRDNAISYYTDYINIDSSFRNTIPIPQTDDIKWIKLENNPLRFKFNSNTLEIIDMGNESNIQIDDKIMVTGVLPIKKTLKTIYGKKNEFKLFEFKNGSKYLKINYKHLMKFPDKDSSILDYDKFRYIESYDTHGVEIELNGIQGELGSNYIGNIPINTINGIHQVLLYDPNETVESTYSDNSFYIELITEYSSSSAYNVPAYNVELIYYYLAGIPINQINAEYPIDSDHAVGYHRVLDFNEESFIVSLPKFATLLDESICSDGKMGTCAGGNTVNVAKIQELIPAYPDPNHYLIKLPNTYSDVVYVKMISSEFPNIQKNIIGEGGNKNNKLYWQNLEDGDIIYNIDIDEGIYDPNNLKNIIEEKIIQVKRNFSRNVIDNSIEYSDNNIVKLSIDQKTNIVTFTSYTQAIVAKPFIDVNPPIENVDPVGLLKYTITIGQRNHKLKVGDKILINNSLSYFGIPSEVLNKEHTVTEIIDSNQYKIIVKNFNLENTKINTGGGSSVSILTPNIFRLRFDFPDTIGKILGFRNTGSSIAITPYNNIITNKDEYEKELPIDEEGNLISFENNSLLFSGDNYILVVCKQIKGIVNFGVIKDAFAKILLPDPLSNSCDNFNNLGNSKIILNTFVDAPIYFHTPIRNLTELEFEFYTPEGEPYDFDGLDHSFTLEIVTMSETPKGTGITSFTGKIN